MSRPRSRVSTGLARVAGQLLEQQRPDSAERTFDGMLVRGPQDAGRQDVAAQDPLRFHQGMIFVDGPWSVVTVSGAKNGRPATR